jgi:hypothetical protein
MEDDWEAMLDQDLEEIKIVKIDEDGKKEIIEQPIVHTKEVVEVFNESDQLN